MINFSKLHRRLTEQRERPKANKKRIHRHERRSLRTAIRQQQEYLDCFNDYMAGHAEVWL